MNSNEPTPPAGEVVKPVLGELAAQVWDRVAPGCIAMGTLTTVDAPAFATLCTLQAAFERLSCRKRPDVRDLVKLSSALRPYYEKFGLEPVGRARISVPKREEPKSKWAGKLA